MNDITVIYITANEITEYFAFNMRRLLKKAVGDTEIVSVSKEPIDFGFNVHSDTDRSHIGIYRDTLKGAKIAKTEYIAVAEDDTLYSKEHFEYRPKEHDFAYDLSCWGIYTWSKPAVLSHRFKARANHNMLLCRREAYIEALEERFAKYPRDEDIDIRVWAEPGKYEDHLGVTVRKKEEYYSNPPNIMFSHPQGLSHHTIGEKKRLGEIRAVEIPYWGRAEDLMKLYV